MAARLADQGSAVSEKESARVSRWSTLGAPPQGPPWAPGSPGGPEVSREPVYHHLHGLPRGPWASNLKDYVNFSNLECHNALYDRVVFYCLTDKNTSVV